MMGLQADDFTDTKARAVYGFEQNLVFQVSGGGKETFYFFGAQSNGQFFGPWPWRDMKTGFIPLADIFVKADDGGKIVVAGPPG